MRKNVLVSGERKSAKSQILAHGAKSPSPFITSLLVTRLTTSPSPTTPTTNNPHHRHHHHHHRLFPLRGPFESLRVRSLLSSSLLSSLSLFAITRSMVDPFFDRTASKWNIIDFTRDFLQNAAEHPTFQTLTDAWVYSISAINGDVTQAKGRRDKAKFLRELWDMVRVFNSFK